MVDLFEAVKSDASSDRVEGRMARLLELTDVIEETVALADPGLGLLRLAAILEKD